MRIAACLLFIALSLSACGSMYYDSGAAPVDPLYDKMSKGGDGSL